MSNVVQPRWKRRADEIADAIGDELSVTVLAPVDVGNDVRIHSDSITSFANSIAAVLPTAQEIAAAMWTYSSRTVGTDALKASDLNLDVTGKVRVVGEGHISVDVTHVDGNTIAGGAAVPVQTTGNNTVAVTGQVSTNIGNVTVPISNPNNITVPVTNPNNLTVPVHVGNATVPVKASTSGVAQNIYGNTVVAPVANSNNVSVPVTAAGVSVPVTNPNSLTVPVANSNNVTVPVTAGGVSVPVHVPSGTSVPASVSNTLSVPVHVGSAVVPVQNSANVSVPVANSNNISVPVSTVSGTTQAADASGAAVTVPANWSSAGTLDVNVKEINSTALTSTTLDVNTTSAAKMGTITSITAIAADGYVVTDDNGGVHSQVYVFIGSNAQTAQQQLVGLRVHYVAPYLGSEKWAPNEQHPSNEGIIDTWSSASNLWQIRGKNDVHYVDQSIISSGHVVVPDFGLGKVFQGLEVVKIGGVWYVTNTPDVTHQLYSARIIRPGWLWFIKKEFGGGAYSPGDQLNFGGGNIITFLDGDTYGHPALIYLNDVDAGHWRNYGIPHTGTTYIAQSEHT